MLFFTPCLKLLKLQICVSQSDKEASEESFDGITFVRTEGEKMKDQKRDVISSVYDSC